MKLESAGKDIIISDFNEAEALRLAMKLESDGIRYYTELSKKAASEDVRKMLRRLADEEAKHLGKFKDWFEKSNPGEEADRGDEEGPFDFIDSGVFGDIWKVEETLAGVKSDKDAVTLGEWAELNSIKFYRAIYEKTSDESGRKILKGIIKEEQDHLKAFARYRELLVKCENKEG